MSLPEFTPLPIPPTKTDPTNFALRADTFLGALPVFANEGNAIIVWTNQQVIAVDLLKTEVIGIKDQGIIDIDLIKAETIGIKDQGIIDITNIKDQAVIATDLIKTETIAAKNIAEAARDAALALANFKGEWSTLIGALDMPASVIHEGTFWILTANVLDVTLLEPGVDLSGTWKMYAGGGAGATGGGIDQVFYENDQIVLSPYTIKDNKNAMTTGPIVIDAGIEVVIPSGSRWVIL